MLPRINSVSFELNEKTRVAEGWAESEALRQLTEVIKDKVSIEYRDSINQDATDIVARIAVLSTEEYCELMEYIELLEFKVEMLESIMELTKDKKEGII